MLERVYVWQAPVRTTHWLNFINIIMLSITGIYIGNPYMHAISVDQYIMGWMRFLHLAFGYLFLITLLLRIYWLFAGNDYADWRAFNPFNRERFRDSWEHTKFYLHIRREPVRDEHYGHTATSVYAYFFLFLLYLFEIFSGFALFYISDPSIIKWILGGWLLSLMHFNTIRLWHHLIMWVIIAFVIGHVYLAWFMDRLEHRGIMSSIFSGYKFVEKER